MSYSAAQASIDVGLGLGILVGGLTHLMRTFLSSSRRSPRVISRIFEVIFCYTNVPTLIRLNAEKDSMCKEKSQAESVSRELLPNLF